MPQVYTITTKNAFAELDESDSDDLIQAKPTDVDAGASTAGARPADAVEADFKPQSRRTNNNNNSVPQVDKQQQQPRRPRPNNGAGPPSPTNGEAGAGERRQPRKQGVVGPSGSNQQPLEKEPRSADANPGPKFPHHLRRGKDMWTENQEKEHMNMDRRSGTGRGRETKREGGGNYNWGSSTLEYVKFEDDKPQGQAGQDRKGEREDSADPTNSGGRPQEEPVKIVSYSAYKAEQDELVSMNLLAKDEDDEAEKMKYEQQGYKIYTKAARALPSEKKPEADGDDATSKPKTVHLAELAAQAGVELKYGGNRRPRRDNNSKPEGRRPAGGSADRSVGEPGSGKDEKAKGTRTTPQQPQQQRHEINLADKLAFPTLEAH